MYYVKRSQWDKRLPGGPLSVQSCWIEFRQRPEERDTDESVPNPRFRFTRLLHSEAEFETWATQIEAAMQDCAISCRGVWAGINVV